VTTVGDDPNAVQPPDADALPPDATAAGAAAGASQVPPVAPVPPVTPVELQDTATPTAAAAGGAGTNAAAPAAGGGAPPLPLHQKAKQLEELHLDLHLPVCGTSC